jgi:hypothetical protein
MEALCHMAFGISETLEDSRVNRLRMMRPALTFVVLYAWATASYAQDTNWLISGFVGAGPTSHLSEPAGVVGVVAELQAGRWSPRVSAEVLRIGRTCKSSLPPICGNDTPGGELLILGVGYVVAHPGPMMVIIRPEVGVARWLDNIEAQRYTRATAGIAADARFLIGTGALTLGVRVLASDPVVSAAAMVGLGIRF